MKLHGCIYKKCPGGCGCDLCPHWKACPRCTRNMLLRAIELLEDSHPEEGLRTDSFIKEAKVFLKYVV